MTLFARLRRWVNGFKPAQPFAPGMTLKPGESAVFDLPPELVQQLNGIRQRGGDVTFKEGPVLQDGRQSRRAVSIMVNGEEFAEWWLEWTDGGA